MGHNIRVGPFCVIGENVELGDDCILHSHVVLEGHSKFGCSNEFFAFTAIGGKTQDLKYASGPTYLEVGNHNVFRENCTVHRSTHADTVTRIGSHNLFLCYSHVAHDCQIGDHVILSNSVALAGHIEVADYAIISGAAAIHQFCRIGQHALVGGLSRIVQDVSPFMIVEGNPSKTRGLNAIGLQRRGFDEEEIKALKVAYKKLFLKKDTNLAIALSSLKATDTGDSPSVKHLMEFIEASQRGITR